MVSQAEIIAPDTVGQLEIIGQLGKGDVYGVTLSPDGKTLAVATRSGVYLYDLRTGEQTQFIDLPIIPDFDWGPDPSQGIDFSPDGHLLAVGYKQIVIWNLAKNQIETRIYNTIAGFKISQLAWASQGTSLVVLSQGLYAPCDAAGGNYAIYDLATHRMLYSDYFCTQGSLSWFHFAILDKGRVAFVTNAEQLTIVDAITGAKVKALRIEGKMVASISPDGSRIAVKTNEDPVSTKILAVDTLTIVDEVSGEVLFTQDEQVIQRENRWLITDWDQQVICTFTEKPQILLGIYRSLFELEAGRLVYWNSMTQAAEVWDMRNCRLERQIPLTEGDWPLKYSPNGRYLITNSFNSIALWDTTTGKLSLLIPGALSVYDVQSIYYGFDSSGERLALIRDLFKAPYNVSVWDVTTGELLTSIATEIKSNAGVFLAPDGRTVIAHDSDQLYIWEVDRGNLLNTIPFESDDAPYINPERPTFVSIENDELVLHSLRSGEVEKRIALPEGQQPAAFSPDWQYMLLRADGHWELFTMDGERIRALEEYPPLEFDPSAGANAKQERIRTYSPVFSPDSRLLIAIYQDSDRFVIRFWDTATGAIVREISLPFEVAATAFSPDGKKLAMLSDGLIYIWGIRQP
jgi:WD40 repeat protein